ncbi:MAG: type II secretion system F family protein [Lachnospiraceae bacterium]
MKQNKLRTKQNLGILKQSSEAFFKEKVKTEILMLVVGLVLILAYVTQQGSDMLEDGYYVRPSYGDGSETLVVTAGEYNQTFELEIQERTLVLDEALALYEELVELLPALILGENTNLDQIQLDLILPTAVEGFPFKLEWDSNQEEIIDDTGHIQEKLLDEPVIIILEVFVSFEEYEWLYQIPIQVLPRNFSEEELYYRSLQEYLMFSEELNREDARWELPSLFEEKSLQIDEVSESKLFALGALLIVTMLCYWFAHDQELQKRREDRREVFVDYYEGIVSKISMYVTAGLTMQSAVKQCMEEYSKDGVSTWVKESFTSLNKEIYNGTSFYTALELWATSCDYHEYDKLVSILRQGERNDTTGIAFLLMEEAREARRTKIGQIKVKGNQISTKLLAPMMLQLGVVMALIMIPAFMSFQM